jgi:hypothetical protein
MNFLIGKFITEAVSIGTEVCTAGLGYLEVKELSKQIFSLGSVASIRTVNSIGGEGYNYSTDFKP